MGSPAGSWTPAHGDTRSDISLTCTPAASSFAFASVTSVKRSAGAPGRQRRELVVVSVRGHHRSVTLPAPNSTSDRPASSDSSRGPAPRRRTGSPFPCPSPGYGCSRLAARQSRGAYLLRQKGHELHAPYAQSHGRTTGTPRDIPDHRRGGVIVLSGRLDASIPPRMSGTRLRSRLHVLMPPAETANGPSASALSAYTCLRIHVSDSFCRSHSEGVFPADWPRPGA